MLKIIPAASIRELFFYAIKPLHTKNINFNTIKQTVKIITRAAVAADAAAISLLSAQLGYPVDEAETNSRLNAILINKDNCVFVAVENEKLAGWVHGFYTSRIESGFFVEIGGLVVDENSRRKGLGKILVNEVITWAQQRNCNTVRVRCNVKRNDSHLFYLSAGFKSLKEQKVFEKKI